MRRRRFAQYETIYEYENIYRVTFRPSTPYRHRGLKFGLGILSLCVIQFHAVAQIDTPYDADAPTVQEALTPKTPQAPVISHTLGTVSVDIHITKDQIVSASTLADTFLTLTAYPPSPPNGRPVNTAPLAMTGLDLTGFTFPLTLTLPIAAQALDPYSGIRLSAVVKDRNGNESLKSIPQSYNGRQAPVLTLTAPDPDPDALISLKPIGLEIINGQVWLNDRARPSSRSRLFVRLIDDGLAGRPTRLIAAETIYNIDGKPLPFDFTLERGLPPVEHRDPLAFNIWIEDSAGRKTHVMDRTQPYNGADIHYMIRLDRIKTGDILAP